MTVIDTITGCLAPASAEALAAAIRGPRSRAHHDACAAMVPALSAVEVRPPERPAAVPARLRVAAWNAERCAFGPESRALLDRIGADVVLLAEVDQGMARSGNRHTVADLAAPEGAGFAYGVEFVETGKGHPHEAARHPGLENAASFHGNAILSRARLADVFLVRLDDGGVWYQGPSGDRELRLGYRNAVVARLADAPRRLWLASVHLESSSDPEDRARQVARLLAAIDARAGGDAVILGGDFNTRTLRDASGDVAALMDEAERREPLFGVLAAAGFAWAGHNGTAVTQRTRPDGAPLPPFARLDWLFARGVAGGAPGTVAAVGAAGAAISDHDAVVAEFALA
ncbi:endonuclease/exonuclease/phosphatase family protein [Methylobacterium sp. JK268]